MQSSERLKGIDVFVCVADQGSFAAAADCLSLTSSAVSKSIARLEARLGLRLFERTTRRLALTDAGNAFYRTCSRVLADLEESELSLHADYVEARGRVRIDLPAAYGRLHVMPALLDYLRHHPLLTPHISFTDTFVDPVAEGIDILVRIGGSDVWPEELGHRYIGTQRFIFCAAPSYLEARGTPLAESDLDSHDIVVYGHTDGAGSHWHLAGAQPGERERREMPARMTIGDGEAVVLAVAQGYGIAQLPTWLVKHKQANGEVVEVLPNLATDGLPMNLVWLKKREALPKVSVLLKVLASTLRHDGHQLVSNNS
ncbi:TPA: LysR family transcriptional regulator [Pseudomonas aeruginosa]|uniref:LysR family transcriptional regulator n=1 Tax=Pseudomonas aeruginosa group TaxID=136841 RepID=UPI0005BABCF9|nr:MULTISPECIES: LysR family transcriptional regulator [Pseudomonas aeruginosa group]MDF3933265.1 LysR family transcriptional regulator [Pseudomonas citronellolis]MDI9796829.1 LysR family transcriptional regulator [Pseudomonas aeruginosa]NPX94241.1 LysR family transcriptional regulator [Pseudomonas aeruginosa]HBO4122726.1 LysR family transcriptional regulator [Pseudomonas aeruginosa]HBO4250921.1 LysR family transcriptional regulator [Pseudomonas aeruginosa]